MQPRRSNEPRVTMQPLVTTISAAPGMSNPDRGTGDREHAGGPDLGNQQAQQQRHECGPGRSSGTPLRLAPGSACRGAARAGRGRQRLAVGDHLPALRALRSHPRALRTRCAGPARPTARACAMCSAPPGTPSWASGPRVRTLRRHSRGRRPSSPYRTPPRCYCATRLHRGPPGVSVAQ